MDPLLLEAMREVDAMYPDTPPIAPQEVPGRFYEVDVADNGIQAYVARQERWQGFARANSGLNAMLEATALAQASQAAFDAMRANSHPCPRTDIANTKPNP